MTKFDIKIYDCPVECVSSLSRMIESQIRLIHKHYNLECPDIPSIDNLRYSLTTPNIITEFSEERKLNE